MKGKIKKMERLLAVMMAVMLVTGSLQVSVFAGQAEMPEQALETVTEAAGNAAEAMEEEGLSVEEDALFADEAEEVSEDGEEPDAGGEASGDEEISEDGQPEEADDESEFAEDGQPEEADDESEFAEDGQSVETVEEDSAFSEDEQPEDADEEQLFSESGQSKETDEAEPVLYQDDKVEESEEAASVPDADQSMPGDGQSGTDPAEAAGNTEDDGSDVIVEDTQVEETVSEEASAGTVSGDWTYTLKDNGLTIDSYNGSETDVVIPDTIDGYKVSNIGRNAFYNNFTMQSVTIPVGITSIGAEAFRGCIALNTINYNAKNCTFPSIWRYDDARGVGVFSGAGSASLSLTVIFGSGISSVPANMFATASIGEYGLNGYDYAHITSIVFSDSIKEIGNNAFRNCDNLESVELGSGITTIGTNAFNDCDSIINLVLDNNLQTIQKGAFCSCDSIETIQWGSSLDTIDQSAFEGCGSLLEAVIPSPVRTIGIRAFADCHSLTKVVLPASLNTLKGEAFAETTRLSKLIISAANMYVAPPWIYDDAKGVGVFSGAGSGVSALNVTFTSGVKTIPANMFYTASTTEYGLKGKDYAHVTSVTFKATIREIGKDAFRTTNDLKNVYFPGNEEKWNLKTTILGGNEGLEGATVHFGSQLKHDLTTVKATKATLTKDGNLQHYKCRDCGSHFSDSAGTIKITEDNYMIPAASNISLSASSLTYTGAVRKPTVKVLDRNKKTIAKANYSLSWSNASSITTGTYYVTVNLAGTRYAATKKLTYKITPASIAKASVTGIKAKVYTGNEIGQSPVVKVGTTTLKKGTDYTISYLNNKNVGTATVTITGKGNYKGTIKKTFRINPKPTTITKLTAASGAFTAVWKKQAVQTTGYQIQYSTDSTFESNKKIKTVASATTVKQKISGLTKGRQYYVRIRTYKTIDSTKYYSAWSTVNSVKTGK